MLKSNLLLLTLLCPLVVQATAVGTAPVPAPEADPQRCNQERYYNEFRTQADSTINTTHDAKANEIHADNQANPDTVADETTTSLSNFLQYQRDVCDSYINACAGADIENVDMRRVQTNFGRCLEEAQERFDMAMGLSYNAAMLGTQRKVRSTITEQIKGINSRMKTYTLAITDNLRKELQNFSSKASFLIRQTRDVDGGAVQDT